MYCVLLNHTTGAVISFSSGPRQQKKTSAEQNLHVESFVYVTQDPTAAIK